MRGARGFKAANHYALISCCLGLDRGRPVTEQVRGESTLVSIDGRSQSITCTLLDPNYNSIYRTVNGCQSAARLKASRQISHTARSQASICCQGLACKCSNLGDASRLVTALVATDRARAALLQPAESWEHSLMLCARSNSNRNSMSTYFWVHGVRQFVKQRASLHCRFLTLRRHVSNGYQGLCSFQALGQEGV